MISPREWGSFRVILPLVLFFTCLCSSRIPIIKAFTAAQDRSGVPYALIFGTVWGPDDHPVYGVKVKIRRADEKKAHWELFSDHRGEFAQRVPAGKRDYVVWADLKGFKLPNGTRLQPGDEVPVHIENDERVDIGIHLK